MKTQIRKYVKLKNCTTQFIRHAAPYEECVALTWKITSGMCDLWFLTIHIRISIGKILLPTSRWVSYIVVIIWVSKTSPTCLKNTINMGFWSRALRICMYLCVLDEQGNKEEEDNGVYQFSVYVCIYFLFLVTILYKIYEFNPFRRRQWSLSIFRVFYFLRVHVYQFSLC